MMRAPAKPADCGRTAPVWGVFFFYVPTPDITAGSTFEPPNIYNMPPQVSVAYSSE